MSAPRRYLWISAFVAAMIVLAALLFGGCTIRDQIPVPRPIVSTHASADGNTFNSGDISYDKNGAIKSPYWLTRYDAMLSIYGKRFKPEVKPGDRNGIVPEPPNYRVTAQVSARFTRMNVWEKAEAGP